MSVKNKIKVIKADITTLEVDAIVNAASTDLLGGGGVDGAIHRAAGPELLEKTRTLNGVETGQAKMTGGYRLPARYIIHTAGPIYKKGNKEQADLLASCYRSTLELAKDHQLRTIAYPSISTGIYGYPLEEAVPIAVETVADRLKQEEYDGMEEVIFVCFSDQVFDLYEKEVSKLG